MYKKGHIHFVGIGGIGMSGIAKVLKNQGYHISGCDLDLEQQSVKELVSAGCEVHLGNNTPLCDDPSITILVYSSAIKPDCPEIQQAQVRGIPTISRALMLAELMRTKYSIAITGAHGKTTTTSLISHIFIESKKDPTVIVGGHLKNISTHARFGHGDFLIAEADESDRSLLRLYPTLAVVTNIDNEHLDTYKDIEDIKQTFTQFLTNIPFYGKAFVCIDDPHIRSIMPLSHIKTIKYGIDDPDADICATRVHLGELTSTFDIYIKQLDTYLKDITIQMPGRHNVLNATAAIAVALDVEIDPKSIAEALTTFKGVERRFTFKGSYHGAELYDDYGHHPTEIFNTLLVARKKARNKLIVVFQPQRYSRTEKLWNEFIALFAYSPIDHLIITDIYAASETPIDSINSSRFVRELKQKQPSCNVQYVPYDQSLEAIRLTIAPLITDQDLILTLGAGKVNKMADFI